MTQAMTGKKRKPSIAVGLLILTLFVYAGYSLGLMDSAGYLISADWGAKFFYYCTHPFPLLWDQKTQLWMGLGAAVGIIGWSYYAAGINSRIAGREYGTARFENPAVLTKKLVCGEPSPKILGDGLYMSSDDRKTGLNALALVIGGSGAGKSFRYVKPNILRCAESMLITDPKGELLRDTGAYLQEHGYCIKVLNLVEMSKSNGYNPLAYVRTQDEIVNLVEIIIKNTTPKNAVQSDPFWERGEALYLQSLLFYVWLAPEMEGRRNIRSLISLMKEAKIPENEKEKTILDRKMESLTKAEWEVTDPATGEKVKHPGDEHPAYTTYIMVRSGAVDTVRSIIISANARLGFLVNSPDLLDILSDDDMDIPSLGMGKNGELRKTALFCVISDSKTTYNAVVGMLYSQVFQELYYQADNNTPKGRLPIPVSIWWDEFANVATPNDFTAVLSTMRSRGISANIILQSLAQLKSRYEKEWEIITGNCDTLVYLGGSEQSTHKYISELLGKFTADKRSTSSSTGNSRSSSWTDDVLGRELMTLDEVRMLDNEKEIVLVRGEYPVLCKKYRTEKYKPFLKASSLPPYTPSVRKNQPRPDVQPNIQIMLDNQPDYSATGKIISTSLAQLRRLEKQTQEGNPGYEFTLSNVKAISQPNDSIKERMKNMTFSDDQLQEAVLASADGLSETQILEWFVPENTAKKMELSRKLQLQELMQKRGRGK